MTEAHCFDALLIVTLTINFMHRNITHLFVYGDPIEFSARKTRYISLPLLLLCVSTSCILFLPHYFKWLVSLSVIWTIYHTIMQKVGLLRLYTKKSHPTYGARSDKVMIWLLLLGLIIFLANIESTYTTLNQVGRTGRGLATAFKPHKSLVRMLSWPMFAICSAYIIGYIRYGIQKNIWTPARIHYLVSYVLLLAFFSIDFLTAYAFFSLSHSIEYLTFSQHVARKRGENRPARSAIAYFSRKPLQTFIIYALLSSLILLTWRSTDSVSLKRFIVGTSFLHFLYDGWLWKLRKKDVAQTVEVHIT